MFPCKVFLSKLTSINLFLFNGRKVTKNDIIAVVTAAESFDLKTRISTILNNPLNNRCFSVEKQSPRCSVSSF